MNPITYNARPINGGPFPKARPKPPGEWYYEPKYNGWRALVHGPTGQMWNRHGKPLTIGAEFKAAVDKLTQLSAASSILWWDCEALERRHNIGKGCLIVLDWVPTTNYNPPTWYNRNACMRDYLDELDVGLGSTPPQDFPLLSTPPLIYGTAEVWNDLQAVNKRLGCDFYEGFVAKRGDSLYPVQLQSPDREFTGWTKHRWAY